MILQFSTESGHPIFQAPSALERGELDSKEHGKKSHQFNDDEGNASAEPWQICAKNWTEIHPKIQLQIPPKIQKVQEHFMQTKY